MTRQTYAEAPSRPTAAPVSRGVLQRRCACGGTPGLDGECVECRSKRLALQSRAPNQAVSATAPSIVNEVLRSPGQPLDADTRAFMEPRFGHDFGRMRVHDSLPQTVPVDLTVGPTNDVYEQEADRVARRVMRVPRSGSPEHRAAGSGYDFSGVRVHTDARAAESARAVNALAYTVGQDMVLGAGQYAPGTSAGRQLLAHELTHVVQQRGADRSPAGALRIQRACPLAPSGLGATPAAEECTRSGPESAGGERFDFCQDSAQLVDGQEARLTATIDGARTAQRIEIHGYASTEGPSMEYNYNLSCKRAVYMAQRFRAAGITNVAVFMHGPTSIYPDTALNRNVLVRVEQPVAPTAPAAPTPAEQAVALADGDCAAITRMYEARKADTVGLFLQIYKCLTCSFGAAIRRGVFEDPLWLARVNHLTFQRLQEAFSTPNTEYQRAFNPCNTLDRCLSLDIGFGERLACQGVLEGFGILQHLQSCTERIGGVHLKVDLRYALRTVGCASPANKQDYARVVPLFQSCNRAILSSEFPIGGETVAERIAIPRITEQRNAAWSDAGCP